VDAEFKQTLYTSQLSAQVAQKLEGTLITGISEILLQWSGHVVTYKKQDVESDYFEVQGKDVVVIILKWKLKLG
jgi:hypothetical protein